MKTRLVVTILGGVLLGMLQAPTSGAALTADNVVLISIDGLRNLEAFEDPIHRYTPWLNSLCDSGTVYVNFFNNGATWTTPGHNTMLTGVRELRPNVGSVPRDQDGPHHYANSVSPYSPTVFEILRKAKG